MASNGFDSGHYWAVSLCLCWQRIQIEQIRSDEWFRKGYVPVRLLEYEDVNLDDVNAVFDDPEVGKVSKCIFCFLNFLVYEILENSLYSCSVFILLISNIFQVMH